MRIMKKDTLAPFKMSMEIVLAITVQSDYNKNAFSNKGTTK